MNEVLREPGQFKMGAIFGGAALLLMTSIFGVLCDADGPALAGSLVLLALLIFCFRTIRWAFSNRRSFVLFVFIGVSIFYTSIVALTDSFERNSGLYQDAKQKAMSSAEVQNALGNNLHFGWPISGEMETVGDEGSGSLNVRIRGECGGGRMFVSGSRIAGLWVIHDAYVKANGSGDVIRLAHIEP